jgi:CheY-like chemotaxis protein
MDQNVKQHLFEPFFTTKPIGKGTGLGLATVYGIVAQCGGWIQVESKKRQGTIFRIYLPRVDESVPEESKAVELKPQQLTGTETILVVEDQPQVGAVICSILGAFGYEVLKASNGDEALKLAETHAGTVDLLLTDVMMPGMDGLELAARLRGIRPTPILFMSGYAGRVKELHISGIAYIQKPFSPEALARKVREVLVEGERSSRQGGTPDIPSSE